MEYNWFELVLIIGLILANAFFVASEISIITVRKSRIRQLADEGEGSARSILRLTENNSRFLATIQIGVTLTSFFASAFGAVSLVKVFEDWFKAIPVDFIRNGSSTIAFIVVTLLVAFFTLVFGELVPKTLALEAAERVALISARPVEVLATITRPIVAMLTGITTFFVRLLGGRHKATMPSVSEEEIVSMVETGQEEGVLGKQESEIINRVFEFTDRQVREIMVPRLDIHMFDSELSVNQTAADIVLMGYSRYPIFDPHDRERITGVAFAKDVLRCLTEKRGEVALRDIAREPYFIPESKRVGDLLAELQRRHNQMALVIDEYGGLAGLVTLEDCLEEIVGEIQDEFDYEENRIKPLENGEYQVEGSTTLNEVNEVLNLHFEEDVDTLGGLVLKELGRMAAVGDSVTLKETRQMANPNPESDQMVLLETTIYLTVMEMDGLRIRQVLLKMEQVSKE